MRRLVLMARLLALVALLGLALAGGSFAAHTDQLSYSQVTHSHHIDKSDHSHDQAECCEAEVSETLHCGASLLALTAKYERNSRRSPSVHQPHRIDHHMGLQARVELRPPRPILA